MSAMHNVNEICWLFYGSKRFEVAVNFMHIISPKNFTQKFIELRQSVRIIRQSKLEFAETTKRYNNFIKLNVALL